MQTNIKFNFFFRLNKLEDDLKIGITKVNKLIEELSTLIHRVNNELANLNE